MTSADRKTKRQWACGLILLFIAFPNFFLFQNCSKGFQVQAPGSENPSSLGHTLPPECQFDGQVVAEGVSVTAYQVSTVPFGQSCPTESRTCQNGALNGTYQYSRCEVGASAACLFSGQTIASGQSVTAFQTSTVPFGQACVSESRICTNGSLSGSHSFAACTPGAPAACIFNGQTIAHNRTVTAYQTAIVPAGQTCASQNRICSNGTLSGTFTHASCGPHRPNIRKISVGFNHACVVVEDKIACWGQPFTTLFRNDRITFGTPQNPARVFDSGATDVDVKHDEMECHIINGSLTCSGGRPFQRFNVVTSGARSVVLPQHGLFCAEVSGEYKCWSQFEDASAPIDSPYQRAVLSTNAPILDSAIGVYYTCFVPADRSVRCGQSTFQGPTTSVMIASGASKVSISRSNTICAVVNNQLQCWLRDVGSSGAEAPYYIRPDGSRAINLTPEVIMNDVVDVDVVSSRYYSQDTGTEDVFARGICVVKTDGSVACWGNDRRGQSSPLRTYIPSGAVSVKVSQGAGGFMVVQMADGVVKTKAAESDTFVDVNLYNVVFDP